MFFSLRNQKQQPSAKNYMALALHLLLSLSSVLSVRRCHSCAHGSKVLTELGWLPTGRHQGRAAPRSRASTKGRQVPLFSSFGGSGHWGPRVSRLASGGEC